MMERDDETRIPDYRPEALRERHDPMVIGLGGLARRHWARAIDLLPLRSTPLAAPTGSGPL